MSVPDNLCVTGSVEGGIQQPVELNVSRLNAAYIGLGKIQKSLAFQQAYGMLLRRVAAFAALPIESLNRISLQRAVDDIAQTTSGEPA